MPTLEVEQELLQQGFSLVAGVDEAGRGPLAGPVVAGAVVLPAQIGPLPVWLEGVDDSKKLTSKQRERCLALIRHHAVAVGVGIASVTEIDRMGIAPATRRAMSRAIQDLSLTPDYILVDFVPRLNMEISFRTLVGGDRLSYSIAAASIVAKVTRDVMMEDADRQYPDYGFARNKGYGTREHLRLLSIHGPCTIHRRSFSPVRPALIPLGVDR